MRQEAKSEPKLPSFRARVFRAGGWVLGGSVSSQALRLLSNLILTRLLAPQLFGIMTIVTVVWTVVGLLADIGLTQAIIQSPRGEDWTFLNTAWTLQVLRGWWIWFVCLALSFVLYTAGAWHWLPPDSVYAAPVLPAVIAVTSFSSVISAFKPTKATVLYRNLDIGRAVQVEVVAQVVSIIVSISLAWIMPSIWSLVIGLMAGVTSSVILNYHWVPGTNNHFMWDRTYLREFTHFGKWIFLSSAVGVLASNGDRLLLGGWFDPATLGYYAIAFNLAFVAEGFADRLFGSVSLAAMSEVARRDAKHLPALYFKMRWPSDITLVGTAGFLFATGEWIIHLLYDARYAAAGPMLEMLSFGLLFSRYRLAQKAYVAIGSPRYEAITNVVRVISLFLIVPICYYMFGINGAILGIAFHTVPMVICILLINGYLGINNMRLEFIVLGMWPVGWGVGYCFVALTHFSGINPH
jgi:O-antigen/teichoic acid export membrane protein